MSKIESFGNPVIEGGRIEFEHLTHKIPGIEYAKAKAHMWIYSLNEGNRPVKWLKPNGKGTKMDFKTVQSQAEYRKGLNALSVYLKDINAEFGLDYSVQRYEESEKYEPK